MRRLQKWIDDLPESSHDRLNRILLGVTFVTAVPLSYWSTKVMAMAAIYVLGY